MDHAGADETVRPRRRRRWVVGVVLALLAVALLLAVSAVLAGVRALALQDSLRELQAGVESQDVEEIAAALDLAAGQSAGLNARINGLPLRWLQSAPIIGEPLSTVATLARAADATLTPAPEVAAQIRATPGEIGFLAGLRLLSASSAAITDMAEAAADHAPDVAAIDPASIPAVSDQIADVQVQFDAASEVLRNAAAASVVVPDLFGMDGPTQWLLVPGQPAEARGTAGGFTGAFAVVTGRNGRLSLDSTATNDAAFDRRRSLDPLPEEFADYWGASARYIWGHNQTRHFPYAATLLNESLREDGFDTSYVVALEPHAVAALLKITGPVTAAGVTLKGASAVDYLTNGIYLEFPDSETKDAVALALLEELFNELQRTSPEPVELLRALSTPAKEQRLLVWARDPERQLTVESSDVSGALPDAATPTVSVALNNSAGNKIDYYVTSAIRYAVEGPCTSDPVTGTVRVRLTVPSLPSDLPRYVSGRSDAAPGTYPDGSTAMLVDIYAPAGATLDEFRVDGRLEPYRSGQEMGRPLWGTRVQLLPDEPVDVRLSFSQPAYPGGVAGISAQPMINPTSLSVVDERGCG